ncbi:MAG: helix-turn-helix domain-containing protein [Lachnospiraceae bacterium]
MNFNQELGLKIKKLRLNEKLTLVECSELTGLSVGFLSQIENGKTSISIDNLQIIAKCLDVELNYFFVQDEEKQNVMITRKWSQNSSKKSDKIASTLLSDFENAKVLFPPF